MRAIAFKHRPDRVALGVDLRPDMMRELQCEQGEADASVIGCGAHPLAWTQLPKANVVMPVRRSSFVLLVGEILQPVFKVERADGRIWIDALQNDACDDPDRRAGRQWAPRATSPRGETCNRSPRGLR